MCIFTTYLVFYTKFAHKYSLYVAKRGAKRGRQRGNVVERDFAAFNVVCLVLNEVLCIQRGIMHHSTRLRRVEPRLPRLRRGKRGVFCLTRYYALFPTPFKTFTDGLQILPSQVCSKYLLSWPILVF